MIKFNTEVFLLIELLSIIRNIFLFIFNSLNIINTLNRCRVILLLQMNVSQVPVIWKKNKVLSCEVKHQSVLVIHNSLC